MLNDVRVKDKKIRQGFGIIIDIKRLTPIFMMDIP